MKLPRDISGPELARLLRKFGYEVVRQTGSHLRLSTSENGQHHVTIPNHNPIKLGTFSGILNDVAAHFQITRDELVQSLFQQ